MKLDRNNYEEYFLLYADGELTPAQQKLVEDFVLRHPDLAEELELLQETVLQIDNSITMPGKDKLLKPIEWNQETLTPLQQNMLLYIDNELPQAEAHHLESQLQLNADLQKDMQVLLQTKLVPEAVPMPSKEELYKKEERKRAAIVPMKVIRWMAAAAVLLGFGIFTVAKLGKDGTANSTTTIAATKTPTTKQGTTTPANTLPTPASNTTDNTAAPQNATAANNDNTAKANTAANTTAKKSMVIKSASPTQADNNKITLPTPAPQQEIPQMAIITPEETKRNLAGVGNATVPDAKQIAMNTPPANATPIATPMVDNGQASQALVAANAAYHEDNATEDEYVNIAGAHVKKKKIRGLLRNVTRTVGRTLDKGIVGQVASFK